MSGLFWVFARSADRYSMTNRLATAQDMVMLCVVGARWIQLMFSDYHPIVNELFGLKVIFVKVSVMPCSYVVKERRLAVADLVIYILSSEPSRPAGSKSRRSLGSLRFLDNGQFQ